MSWFYAGLDAKPVGPLSLEELQSRHLSGAVSLETFVIEQSPGSVGVWKRYREAFPAAAPVMTPEIPSVALPALPVTPPTFTPAPAPHPLFPSAPFAPVKPPQVTPPSPLASSGTVIPHHDHLTPTHHTNVWCLWGFGLGVASFLGLFLCGLGTLIAPFSIVISAIGLVQLQKNRNEVGRSMAFAGITLSGLVLMIAFIFGFFYFVLPHIQSYERTATEQTSNDSE